MNYSIIYTPLYRPFRAVNSSVAWKYTPRNQKMRISGKIILFKVMYAICTSVALRHVNTNKLI